MVGHKTEGAAEQVVKRIRTRDKMESAEIFLRAGAAQRLQRRGRLRGCVVGAHPDCNAGLQ